VWYTDCVTSRNLLIENLRIKTCCNEYTTSVLLQACCIVMCGVTLRGRDLLTQNCTGVTVVKICV
jgi:hypothetical protein